MAVDAFLKIEGIEGESFDKSHKGEIQLSSFSWGESNSGHVGAGGGGGGAGKVSMQDFHFVTHVSKASVALFFACASGQHIKSAVLTVRKAGGSPPLTIGGNVSSGGSTSFGGDGFLAYRFTDLLVSSYQTGGPGDEVPTDSFSINFAKIEVLYRQQNLDGQYLPAVQAGWDLAQNRKV